MIGSIALLALLLVIGIFVFCFYKRTTKELAFVRTGWGGQRICADGALFVIPMLHQVVPVKMNTFRMSVTRSESNAMITKDRMRADISVEFFIRVKPVAESIASAAQTLGHRTMNPEQLREIIEAKLESGMRSVASGMTMEELHEQRALFTQTLLESVAEDLNKNGLELESVALTSLDQSNIRYFQEDNLFDAEGKTKLTQTIESRKKVRNDIEQDHLVAIEQKKLEAGRLLLDIQRENEYAAMNQEREISIRKAEQSALIATEEANRNREAEQARIDSEKAIELGRIAADQSVKTSEIDRQLILDKATIESKKSIQLAEQDKQIAISERSEQESAAKSKADEARASAIRSEEKVETVRLTEIANRDKTIEIIKAAQLAEKGTVGIKIQAEAEKAAAENRASALITAAHAERDANIAIAAGKKAISEVEAFGLAAINEAHNSLKDEQISANIRTVIVQNLPAIITAASEPMKHIDSIKIVQLDGLNGASNNTAKTGLNGGDSLADQAVNAALKYRSQGPIVDSLLREIGLTGSQVNGFGNILNQSAEHLNASLDRPLVVAPIDPIDPSATDSHAVNAVSA